MKDLLGYYQGALLRTFGGTDMGTRVPLIFTFFRYQWGSLTIDRHGYGKSKTAFGRSVALTETRVEPFEVYLVIYSSKMKIWHISEFLGALNI